MEWGSRGPCVEGCLGHQGLSDLQGCLSPKQEPHRWEMLPKVDRKSHLPSEQLRALVTLLLVASSCVNGPLDWRQVGRPCTGSSTLPGSVPVLLTGS